MDTTGKSGPPRSFSGFRLILRSFGCFIEKNHKMVEENKVDSTQLPCGTPDVAIKVLEREIGLNRRMRIFVLRQSVKIPCLLLKRAPGLLLGTFFLFSGNFWVTGWRCCSLALQKWLWCHELRPRPRAPQGAASGPLLFRFSARRH